jgi:hypothetical protein
MGALEAIKYGDGKFQLLDQRLLPLETVYLEVPNPLAAWQQIKVGWTANLAALQLLLLPDPLCTINRHTCTGWLAHPSPAAGHGGARCPSHRCDRRPGPCGAPHLRREGQAVRQRAGLPG